jgi:parallel beta-helix repeat protein/predicted outer membrane repeat protein
MKNLITAIAVVALAVASVNATIINIPDDYPTIQQGIDNGNEGDTVLVQPGTYPENLDFHGFNVVLGSWFLITGNSAFVSTTIIDGTQWANVVRFLSGEDSGAQVVGFTIQNGAASFGAGVYCHRSSPTIRNNIISGNSADDWGGGICCRYCNPTIRNNTITNNWAGDDGGGIYCIESSPMIRNNTVSGNRAQSGSGIYCHQSNPTIGNNIIGGNTADNDGAGICCYESSPTISNNTIRENWATRNGGGIYCAYFSNATISGNTITGNSASGANWGYGGGIYCDYSEPATSDNTINRNWAELLGGGIYCRHCSPEISGNAIGDNRANREGGGLYCDDSSPTISKNTISHNSATDRGGGICCQDNSNPTITHSILWGDSAPGAPEIFTGGGSNPVVTACDVQGGWPGQWNIDEDPEFVNPDPGNYHLQMTSPCIDRGDPNSPLDPDGTRADIGAFYFRQEPPATIELMPYTTCMILPPEGGEINYDAWIYNLSDTNIFVDIWAFAFVPGMGGFGPFHRLDNVRVRPGRRVGRNGLSEAVPPGAPAGEYGYVGYIGEFGGAIIDSSFFTFTKLGTPGGEDLGWLGKGDWFEGEGFAFEHEIVLAEVLALRQNYPNPFNASTLIEYQLPVPTAVTLEVYNLLGEKVTTLVDGTEEAGYKSLIWDGSGVSSGIYFYKLTAGSFAETRRMMIVR